MLLQPLREHAAAAWRLHLELPRNGLVTWTSGNVSARDRDAETGLVVIKPSGLRYAELRPEHMVIVDLDGRRVEGDLKPSSDTASHLYIYRRRPDVNGVVHTHSPSLPLSLRRADSRGSRQGRSDGRGCGPHGLLRPATGPAGADP